MNINESKPCLVQTSQGFSVKYQNRLLYSKYNPSKSIIERINNLEILPGTLILAVSPVLPYGIKELCRKLPENCFILGIEKDSELLQFHLENAHTDDSEIIEKFRMLKSDELYLLPEKLNSFDSEFRGKFKRVIQIEFSAGFNFYSDFYAEFYKAMQNSIAQFWKNRVTLVKFGKNYSRNFFRNLYILPESINLQSLKNTVSKPILVLGAGESLEQILKEDSQEFKKFYIIACDASLHALESARIFADSFVTEESQTAISKAFVGLNKKTGIRFISLSAKSSASEKTAENTCFYTTLFDDTGFLRNLSEKNIIPEMIPPLGSVGLSAVYLALYLRKNENIPVCISGLDFSFSKGKTHGNGTYPSRLFFSSITKISSFWNSGSSFGNGSFSITGKNSEKTFTTQNLFSYAELFNGLFTSEKNLFDVSKTGIPLNIPVKNFKEILKKYEKAETLNFNLQKYSDKNKSQISEFLENEKNALIELKSILTSGQNIPEAERNAKILELLKNREYLYLHFPDGIKPSLEISFLKRVRIEIDSFLKIFE